jgi:hypothetical protein
MLMSATRRGAKRRPNDLYETPGLADRGDAAAPRQIPPRHFLEPAVGNGAIAAINLPGTPNLLRLETLGSSVF